MIQDRTLRRRRGQAQVGDVRATRKARRGPQAPLPRVGGLLLALALGGAVMPAIAEAQAAAAPLPAQARRIAEYYAVPPEAISIYVHEVGAAQPAYVHLPDTPRNPASTMKVVTTYAALELLGPDYAWETRLFANGEIGADGVLRGDLILQAGGDPSLVAERLWLLQQRLRLAGVREITGDLVIEEGFFAEKGGNAGAFDGQPFRTYNVLPADLLLNFQSVLFRFEPVPGADRVVVRTDVPVEGLVIDNRLRLADGPCRGYQRGISFDADDGGDRLRVIFSGRFPAACEAYGMRRALRATHAFNYGLFKAMWEESGGRLAGGFRVRPTPTGVPTEARRALVEFRSPSLAEVVRSVNKYSNNVMARHLLLTIGGEASGDAGTQQAGVAAVRRWLASKGVDDEGLVIDNGAGLSRRARISTRQMGQVLLNASSSLYRSELIASMPLGGMDGTLRRRFRDAALAGRLHMKTGSLDHVSAIAGFVTTASGREYVVVVASNHDEVHRGPGEELEEAIVGWVLAAEPGGRPLEECTDPVQVTRTGAGGH